MLTRRCLRATGRSAAFLLAASLLTAQKQPVTLESLKESRPPAAGFAPGRVWHPQGGRFVWIADSKLYEWNQTSHESKELLSLESAQKRAVQVPEAAATDWENRRVQEQKLQWSSDGKRLLMLIKGDLFIWDTPGGEIEQLTATAAAEHDPKLSPDGTKVSFRRGYELYVLDLATKQETRLTFDGSATRYNAMLDWVYPEELDLNTAHWWSPDSKHIAYMQFDVSREHVYGHIDHLPIDAVSEPQRYPKAGTPNADVHVGVVDAGGGETRWFDLGEPRLYLYARLHWTPDSQRVVVHRLNRVQDHLEILFAGIADGAVNSIASVADRTWIRVQDDFRFLKDGSIVTTSEGDGFRHIYKLSADGRSISQLTAGDWEVTGISCVDEQRQRIWYTSSEPNPLERQLYSVGFDGKSRRRVTQGAGTHSISMSPACDLYIDSYSSFETPAVTSLHDGAGKQLRVLKEANREALDKYEILPGELHSFKGPDGTLFSGRLLKPVHFDPKVKYPVIVQVYGGPGSQTVANRWSGGLTLEQVLAHKGFLIWQMDNRGAAGRGHSFESALYRRLGKAEVEDQTAGVAYLVSLGFADPKRVGVMGWSYGGYMTLMCLLTAPEVFTAGAAGAPVTDWRNYDTIYTERYLGLPADNPDGYRDSSPVNLAAKLTGKLLLIHNMEDDNVLFANSLQMQRALQEAGKHYELLVYPQKSHGVSGKARNHLNAEYVRFFESALK